jgi:hypothetical protein
MSKQNTAVPFYKIQDIDFSQLKFIKNKKFNGNRFVEVFYNKKNFGIKLPRLRIPYDTRVSYGKIEANFSLKDQKNLEEAIIKFDESIPIHAKEQGWEIDNLTYFEMLRRSKNNDYPPTIKFKIVSNETGIKTSFFDSKKEPVNVKTTDEVLELLRKGTNALTGIQCLGVWFNENMYGVAWKLCQVRICETIEEIMEECNFEDSSNDGNSIDSCTEFLIEE